MTAWVTSRSREPEKTRSFTRTPLKSLEARWIGGVDKEMAVEAVHQATQYQHDLRDQTNPYEGENRESLELDQGYEQDMNDQSNNRAAEAIETEEMEFSFS